MMPPVITNLATRYARALHETAADPAALDALERDLFRLAEFYQAQPAARMVFGNTSLPSAWRAQLCREMAAIAQNSAAGRLVELLVSRKRLTLLPVIAQAWRALRRAADGLLQVLVETPAPMPAAEQQALARRLTGILGKQVELDMTVKPELLGGLVLYYNGRMLDGSVRGRLREARDCMLARQTAIA